MHFSHEELPFFFQNVQIGCAPFIDTKVFRIRNNQSSDIPDDHAFIGLTPFPLQVAL